MTLHVRRLAFSLGAEITGLDISKPLDGKSLDGIRAAFLEHCVLVFRGCPLTRRQHVEFSRYFGDLEIIRAKLDERPPEFPEMTLVISKPKPNGEPASGRYTGQEWHTDHSHLPVAAAASLLRSIEVPQLGGDTAFCNMYRAYDTLSDGMKKLLEGLYGVHMQGRAQIDNSTPERAAESRRRYPAAAHPRSGCIRNRAAKCSTCANRSG